MEPYGSSSFDAELEEHYKHNHDKHQSHEEHHGHHHHHHQHHEYPKHHHGHDHEHDHSPHHGHGHSHGHHHDGLVSDTVVYPPQVPQYGETLYPPQVQQYAETPYPPTGSIYNPSWPYPPLPGYTGISPYPPPNAVPYPPNVYPPPPQRNDIPLGGGGDYNYNVDRVITQRMPSDIPEFIPPRVDELPQGRVVRVFCKAYKNCSLAVMNNRLVVADADSADESQQWIKDERYGIRIRDTYEHPAFKLVNKACQKVLKHPGGNLQEAQLVDYEAGAEDDNLFWTESQDFGEGFKTIRMASDTLLNLSVAADDRSSIILDTWHKKDSQLWKIFPL